MTTAPDFMKHGAVHHDTSALRRKWKWILALGIVFVATGMLALASVVTATFAGVFFVGIMMMFAGVAEVINAFQVKSWGSFLFWALLVANPQRGPDYCAPIRDMSELESVITALARGPNGGLIVMPDSFL